MGPIQIAKSEFPKLLAWVQSQEMELSAQVIVEIMT